METKGRKNPNAIRKLFQRAFRDDEKKRVRSRTSLANDSVILHSKICRINFGMDKYIYTHERQRGGSQRPITHAPPSGGSARDNKNNRRQRRRGTEIQPTIGHTFPTRVPHAPYVYVHQERTHVITSFSGPWPALPYSTLPYSLILWGHVLPMDLVPAHHGVRSDVLTTRTTMFSPLLIPPCTPPLLLVRVRVLPSSST